MSHYVYEVSGARTVTVMTGFNCHCQSFFADVFPGTDLNATPIHSWDAKDHREIAGCMESVGLPMHIEALNALYRDQTEAIFDNTDIERRFEVLPPIEMCEISSSIEPRLVEVIKQVHRRQRTAANKGKRNAHCRAVSHGAFFESNCCQ
ncbi:hypothetical protein [Diaphorobacter sp. LR2014-1]|uniref:hypothetical protein n=1 Tax=Diaphorobacter sp. LR2014-1 TaxID=1933219 RepID=UPI0011AF7D3C|nr:hypothetical protein [Diaphorobacter sp. LR2014-1]